MVGRFPAWILGRVAWAGAANQAERVMIRTKQVIRDWFKALCERGKDGPEHLDGPPEHAILKGNSVARSCDLVA